MAEFGFPKTSRLLNAADYKAVFSNAQFKVSCRHFLVLANCNSRSSARLGLVIAKKNVALAVQRNRIKRQLRSTFRHNRELLDKLDLVVLARKDAHTLDNKELKETIDSLWQDLHGKMKRAAAESQGDR
ncbi:MAG: ribonuclease P protein component [SAR86 cluster bacterium]|uniref:Ribonuclease P protein component n=1 Tax=SAR86 cluster bacterium TaxID=2030880 RepID=A0A2A4X556_9GAMM|nr:MAG: ribonuclease P protein component [SAR86 cluster bacterium]